MFKKSKNMHKIFILLLFLSVSSFKGYGQPISNCPNNAAVYGQFNDPIYCYNGTQDYTLIINPNFLSIACSGNWNYVLYEDQSFNWNTTQTNLPNLSAIVQQSGLINQTSYTFTSLPPGNYVARVTNQYGFCATSNNNGCGNSQKPFKLSNPAELILSTSTPTVLSCFNSTNGQINITVSGSTALPYTVTLNGLNPQSISTNPGSYTFSNLSAGTYSIQASDNNNCLKTNSVTILAPTQISVTGVVAPLSCNGQNNAQINITPSGGTPPLAFSWSNLANTEDINGLGTGNYTVTITDNNNCFITSSPFTINAVTAIVPNVVSSSPTTCYGGSNGSATISVSGGNAPYTVNFGANTNAISSSGGTAVFSGLPSGALNFNITDAANCSVPITVNISSPPQLTMVDTVYSILCYGGYDYVRVYALGGTPQGNNPQSGYHVSWSGQSSGPIGNLATEITTANPNIISGYYTIDSLVPGNYTITLTDANGCFVDSSITITQPPQLFLVENHVNNFCYNGATGSIDLTTLGGTAPYSYMWNGPGAYTANTQDISWLAAGAYSVTVTDANGCQTSITNIDITTPTALTVTGIIVNNNIDLSVGGGTLPYNYSWSNGAVTQDLPNVTPGTYIVSVTDANNCTVSDTFIVNNASIDGNELSEITLFPNPAMDKLTIRGGAGSLAQQSFFVQDCYGRIIAGGSFESDEATVSVEHLAPGLYYLHIGLNSISFVVIH